MESTTRGFTLLELMVTLAVAAILFSVAVPNMQAFARNNRLTAASNDLLRSFHLARTEAIKRQQNVVVCASADPTAASPVCSYGDFTGWIVFQDTNANWQADDPVLEPVLQRAGPLAATVMVRADNDGIESYSRSGFANPAAARVPTRNVVLCDDRGITDLAGSSTARALLIDPTGRMRVTKNNAEVSAAGGVAGACP
jgi:type IV fimbrial biogenesis protein FimT